MPMGHTDVPGRATFRHPQANRHSGAALHVPMIKRPGAQSMEIALNLQTNAPLSPHQGTHHHRPKFPFPPILDCVCSLNCLFPFWLWAATCYANLVCATRHGCPSTFRFFLRCSSASQEFHPSSGFSVTLNHHASMRSHFRSGRTNSTRATARSSPFSTSVLLSLTGPPPFPDRVSSL